MACHVPGVHHGHVELGGLALEKFYYAGLQVVSAVVGPDRDDGGRCRRARGCRRAREGSHLDWCARCRLTVSATQKLINGGGRWASQRRRLGKWAEGSDAREAR